MNATTTEKLYTTGQVARILRVTERQVRKLCRQGRLGRKLGHYYVIGERELRMFRSVPRPVGRPKAMPQGLPLTAGAPRR